MSETISVKLPYAAGLQLRRLADHYQMPMTGVLADLIRRDSQKEGINLAQELDIFVEENDEGEKRFVLDIFGLRLPRLFGSETKRFANDLKHIADRGGELLQLDADVEIRRQGSGVIVHSPDGERSMSTDDAKKIAMEILGAVDCEHMIERPWFFDWNKPADFCKERAKISQKVPDTLHRTQGNKWLREAWILGLFAVATDATDLRLVEHDPPDGWVRLGGKDIPIELVEAFEEGRKPDKEFKTGQRKHLSTISEMDHELGLVRCAIERTVKKKEAKENYPKGTVLVVYLNMANDPRTPPNDLLEAIKAMCNEPSSNFDAICILWRNWLFGPKHIVTNGRVCIDWRQMED